MTVCQYLVADAIGETAFPILDTGGFTGRGVNKKMSRKGLRLRKKGQSAVEYAVILGIMAIAAIFIINLMRAGIQTGYDGIANSIASFGGD